MPFLKEVVSCCLLKIFLKRVIHNTVMVFHSLNYLLYKQGCCWGALYGLCWCVHIWWKKPGFCFFSVVWTLQSFHISLSILLVSCLSWLAELFVHIHMWSWSKQAACYPVLWFALCTMQLSLLMYVFHVLLPVFCSVILNWSSFVFPSMSFTTWLAFNFSLKFYTWLTLSSRLLYLKWWNLYWSRHLK